MSTNEQITFSRIRPKIRFHSAYTAEEALSLINSRLRSEETTCEGQTTSGFASIYPPEDQQHFWSPQLTITFENTDEGCEVSGLFGPKPAVWTMFVFFYSLIGFALMILIMIALSFYSLDIPSSVNWLIPVLLMILLSLFLVAYIGQKIGHRQIVIIHKFIEDSFGVPIEID